MNYRKSYEYACSLIEQNVFDTRLIHSRWGSIRRRYATRSVRVRSSANFSSLLNSMLHELHCSHAQLYTKNDIEYFQLVESFGDRRSHADSPAFRKAAGKGFCGIGAFTERHGSELFVRWVLDGSPAKKAGLKVGDQIVEVRGVNREGLRCLASPTGSSVTLHVRRSHQVQQRIELQIRPVRRKASGWFYNAACKSAKVFERAGTRIGYLHLWSSCGDEYEDLLREQLGSGLLQDTDALLLDLRGLMGGASPYLLNVFCPNAPSLEYTYRDGSHERLDFQWRKPVAFLINEYTRSGNEVLAYGIKKYGIGELVGTPSAGAVLAGRPYLLPDGSALYLPIADVSVDGQRLEGNPIQPTVHADFVLPYANGYDGQLERGLDLLS